MFEKINERFGRLDGLVNKETANKNPSKRLGEVEDTVNAVLFLLSDKADYINGENLNVNGGILLK